MNARGSTGAGMAPDLAPPLLLREEALLSPTMKCLKQHTLPQQPIADLGNLRLYLYCRATGARAHAS